LALSRSWQSKQATGQLRFIDYSLLSIGLFDYLGALYFEYVVSVKTTSKRLLFWSPRALCVLLAVFLSLFALDVFDEHLGFWNTILALVIHLIPTWIVLGVLVIAWRREWVGAILFNILALAYLVMAWGRFHWSAYVMISGPLCVVGILFLLNWLHRVELRANA
jgi:hypothetical protein